MKQILKNGVIINYQEHNENSGQAIVLLHGNSHSHHSFKKQATSSPLNNLRLICVDLPGHGDSSVMEKYTLPLMAECIAEFIKIKKLENYIIVGHSLGGHVAIHSLKYHNARGLFIFGTPPMQKPFDPSSFLPNENVAALFQASATSEQIAAIMKDFNYSEDEIRQAVTDYVKTDPNFRENILNTIATSDYEDEIKLLHGHNGELVVVIPNHDKIINTKYIELAMSKIAPVGELIYIESGHSPHVEMPDAFNSILFKFAQRVFESQ